MYYYSTPDSRFEMTEPCPDYSNSFKLNINIGVEEGQISVVQLDSLSLTVSICPFFLFVYKPAEDRYYSQPTLELQQLADETKRKWISNYFDNLLFLSVF